VAQLRLVRRIPLFTVRIVDVITGSTAIALLVSGCQSLSNSSTDTDYMHISKRELLHRLGLPAEIELPTKDAPAREIWYYYYDHPTRGIQSADFQFCGNTVCGYAAEFDPSRLISTESPSEFARVYAYKLRRDHAR
jgi:hypothetical protein